MRCLMVAVGALFAVSCSPISEGPVITVTPPPDRTCVLVDGKADRTCNPGLTNPVVTQATLATTICAPTVPGQKTWVQRQRPPTSYTNALKRRQMAEYQLTGPLSDFEEDHIVALAIGGSPTDPRNLFPQRWIGTAGAHAKDKEEVALWHAVCATPPRMLLADAQVQIIRDWTH